MEESGDDGAVAHQPDRTRFSIGDFFVTHVSAVAGAAGEWVFTISIESATPPVQIGDISASFVGADRARYGLFGVDHVSFSRPYGCWYCAPSPFATAGQMSAAMPSILARDGMFSRSTQWRITFGQDIPPAPPAAGVVYDIAAAGGTPLYIDISASCPVRSSGVFFPYGDTTTTLAVSAGHSSGAIGLGILPTLGGEVLLAATFAFLFVHSCETGITEHFARNPSGGIITSPLPPIAAANSSDSRPLSAWRFSRFRRLAFQCAQTTSRCIGGLSVGARAAVAATAESVRTGAAGYGRC